MRLITATRPKTRRPTDASALKSGARVVIVGAGPIGMKFASELCDRRPDIRVTILGDEPRLPYDRVRLSSFLADAGASEESLEIERPETGLFDLRVGQRVTRLDADASRITIADGTSLSFDVLVLATGSRARWPAISGLDKPGVYSFRDLADAEALAARRARSRHTTIVGGGLLGLETARAMRRFNTGITIVEHARNLMFNQLDDDAAATLQKSVEDLGINVLTRTQVKAVIGDQRVTAVLLSDGSELSTDTLIVAAGIVPNFELARDAGLRVGRGIVVDDQLRTSVANIYAIGECAEHRGIVYGLVQPGLEQASVLASTFAGESAHYIGSALATRLKVLSIPVFSAGEVSVRRRLVQTYKYADDDGRHRTINLDRGRLVGACSVGAWSDDARLQDCVQRHSIVWPWQRSRFRRGGQLWTGAADSAADWPASAIICNCTAVSRGEIECLPREIKTCATAIARQTRASTICGSCKPLLEQIAGGNGRSEPTLAWQWIAVLSTVVALFMCVWLVLPGAQYATSVAASNNWNQLWYHTQFKEWSGYSLLALAGVAGLLSVRKRLPEVSWFGYPSWRVMHIALGLILAAVLFVHTGFRAGNNLNAWLTLCFVMCLITGSVLGGVVSQEHRLAPRLARGLRSFSTWVHVLVLWPLPVLLGFHVIKTYYF